MRDNTIKKTIIKIVYFFAVLLISIFVIGKLSNKDNADMTAKMPEATLPIITVSSNDIKVNPLHGFLAEVDPSYIRGTIWPINADRTMSFSINTFGRKVWDVGYEVRSISGENLVENEELSEIDEKDGIIKCDIQLKDLIMQSREYMLVIKMETENGTAKYYTRIVWTTDEKRYNIDEEIDFVTKFSESTFNRDLAKEYHKKYCEYSGGKKDALSFEKVDIHSDLDSFSWKGLNITEHSKPQVYVTDIHGQTGCYKLQYRVYIKDEEHGLDGDYNVTESFRVKYNPKKMLLLNYERTMNYIFDPKYCKIEKKTVSLGICDPSFEIKENNEGSAFAFVNEGRLFSYNSSDNKLAYLYGFYDEFQDDVRTNWDNCMIKVLNVNEGGDVKFTVSGYMNRGIHEGKVGIAIYDYNAALNSVEEQAFVESKQSAEILNSYVDTLAYANSKDLFYVMMDHNIYEVNLAEKTAKAVVEDIGSGAYMVSRSKDIIAWQDNDLKQVNIMNLSTGATNNIEVTEGDNILAFDFIDEYIVAGKVHTEDIRKDLMGNVIYPMYKIGLYDYTGEPIDENDKSAEGIYTVGAEIKESLVNLKRVQKDGNGSYVNCKDIQLIRGIHDKEGKNIVSQEVKMIPDSSSNGKEESTDIAISTVQINTKSEPQNKLRILKPDQVLFEDNRNVEVEFERDVKKKPFYYVYDIAGRAKVYKNPAKAVKDADERSCVVVGDKNNYIWVKSNQNPFYQLNKLIKMAESYEGMAGKSSVAVCLDLILKYSEVNIDVNSLLEAGNSMTDVLKNSMPDADVLDLDGCALSSVTYYINKDVPVMALMNNDEAVLILGFDEKNYTLMDPNTGKAYKKGKNDTIEMFEENGNHFITYISEEK